MLYNREEDYARAEYYGESVTNIFRSFYSVLREVYISKNAISIEREAFDSCYSLREVYISENVKSIGIDAFEHCRALETVIIAENSKLATIDNYAFYNCSDLTEFIIPASSTEQIRIGYEAFASCSKLSLISLPENVISVAKGAFYDTAWYRAQPEGEIAYLGHIAYEYKGTVPFDSSLSIKEGTTVIADSCFYGQGFLRRIALPESLQYIGETTFSGCTSLLNVTLPENLVSIGSQAFYKCISITEVTIPASVCRINYSAFSYCNSLVKVVFESAEGWVDGYNDVIDFSDPAVNAEKMKAYKVSDYYYQKIKEESI